MRLREVNLQAESVDECYLDDAVVAVFAVNFNRSSVAVLVLFECRQPSQRVIESSVTVKEFRISGVRCALVKHKHCIYQVFVAMIQDMCVGIFIVACIVLLLAMARYGGPKCFDRFFMTMTEREYQRVSLQRPLLSDDEFWKQFYDGSVMSREVVATVRRVFREQLNAKNVRPVDRVCDITDDVDVDCFIDEICEAFSVSVTSGRCGGVNCTFDSIAKAVMDELAVKQAKENSTQSRDANTG
jgi:hypothetical protein